MNRKRISFMTLLLLGISTLSHAGELKTAYDVAKAVKDRYQGHDEKRKLTMVLTNRRGETRTSWLLRRRKRDNDLWKTLLFYVKPADVRGTSTLTIERENEDDLQRIYLPALKKNRRIPQADKGKSWAGTDFSFEDLREMDLKDFNFHGLDSKTIDGVVCWHYYAEPKSEDSSSYGKIESWIRKDNLEPVLGKYYDKKGRHFKELRFKRLERIQGVWTSMHLEMTNLKDKHKTDFITNEVVFNTNLEDPIFTPRGMLSLSEQY